MTPGFRYVATFSAAVIGFTFFCLAMGVDREPFNAMIVAMNAALSGSLGMVLVQGSRIEVRPSHGESTMPIISATPLFLKLVTNKYILGLVAMAAIGGYVWFQSVQIKSLRSDLVQEQSNRAVLEGAVERQRETINAVTEDAARQFEQIDELNKRMSENRARIEEARGVLNRYQGRLDKVANERPELIERKANEAFQDILNRIGDIDEEPDP